MKLLLVSCLKRFSSRKNYEDDEKISFDEERRMRGIIICNVQQVVWRRSNKINARAGYLIAYCLMIELAENQIPGIYLFYPR